MCPFYKGTEAYVARASVSPVGQLCHRYLNPPENKLWEVRLGDPHRPVRTQQRFWRCEVGVPAPGCSIPTDGLE